MADLTFQKLQAVAGVPADTFKVVSGKVLIDATNLIGEIVDELTDEKVTEVAFKLLDIGRKAQIVYNAGKTTGLIQSFPDEISFDSVTENEDGTITTQATLSVTAVMPVQGGEITAPTS